MRNFGKALLAIVLGNLVYFLLRLRLPSLLQHQAYRIDSGLGLDFLLCVIFYVVISAMLAPPTIQS